MIPDVYKTSYVSADMLVEHMNKYNIKYAMLLQGNFMDFKMNIAMRLQKISKYAKMCCLI